MSRWAASELRSRDLVPLLKTSQSKPALRARQPSLLPSTAVHARVSGAGPFPTMHSSFVRVQNVFGFFTTVACVFAAFIAATDLFAARTPTGTLTPQNVQV